MSLLVWLTALLPRPLLNLCLWFISGYYLLVNRPARQAALQYWQQVQPKRGDGTVATLFIFARVSVDRLIMLKQGCADFAVDFAADADVAQLKAVNSGGILSSAT